MLKRHWLDLFAKYCDKYVCLSVCLCARITGKPHGRTSSIFVHVARAVYRSYYDGVAMLYTSGFIDDVIFSYHGASGPELNPRLCLEEVRRVAASVGCQITTVAYLVEFIRMRHQGQNLQSTMDKLWICCRFVVQLVVDFCKLVVYLL